MERTTNYTINNTIFRVLYGDITNIEADALVSSDDNNLTMGGGVSMALARAGGDIIRQETRKHIPLKIGDVAVTSAGNLPAKYIFHAITIDFDSWIYASEETIHSATLKCLQLSDQLQVKHIVFPALGTGAARFPFQLAAEVMTKTISDYLVGETGIEIVTLILHKRGRATEDELNIFYERASALASLSTQTKRLNNLVSELNKIIDNFNEPELSKKMSDLQNALEKAQNNYKEKPGTLERLEQIHDRSGIEKISKDVISISEEAKSTSLWEDKQLEVKVLRTKMQGLQSLLNIQASNLNKLMIDKAKYGGIGVPLRLENAISDIKNEIEETETKVRELRMELAACG